MKMHLCGLLPRDLGFGAAQSAQASKVFVRRKENESNEKIVISAVAAGVVTVVLLLVLIQAIRRSRRMSQNAGLTTTSSKSGNPITWFLGLASRSHNYEAALGHDGRSHQLNSSTRSRHDVEQISGANSVTGINRNTSIRSIVTLPPYSHVAPLTERVLGREGERDGIDTIIDYPTEEREEALRDEEMDAMYRLRQARRVYNAERDDIRRQRQQAQSRRDVDAVVSLHQRSRDARTNQDVRVEELRAEINRAKDNRQRATSTVSYADLGIARHDGSRVRANSNESERMGLLSDAASIAAVSAHARAHSPLGHERGRSRTSIVSFESGFAPPTIPQATASRPGSQSGVPRASSHLMRHSRASSSIELGNSDSGVEVMPPPDYEVVSLDDIDANSNNSNEAQTPLTSTDEPPPDYSGPHRSASLSERTADGDDGENQISSDDHTPAGRGVDGVPRLPSLRISHLPEIVIEPSSAQPGDGDSSEFWTSVENSSG